METINVSLHKEFMQEAENKSFSIICWDLFDLRKALKVGTAHPKFLRAKTLADKIRAKEVRLHKENAISLHYVAPAVDGWALTREGVFFLKDQVERANKEGASPLMKYLWGTENMAYWTMLQKDFDVLTYAPKDFSAGARLFAYLQTEKDLDNLVAAAIKVLMKDEDQVDSEEDDAEVEMLPATDELRDVSSDDEDVEEDGLSDLAVENDPRTLRDRILDLYIQVKEGSGDMNELRSLLDEVVEKVTNFGSDKGYVALPEHGEFDFDQEGEALEQEQAEYQAYRYECIRNGYSDSNNYDQNDMDIENFRDPEVVELEKAAEQLKDWPLSEEETKAVIKAYKETQAEIMTLGEDCQEASRAAYMTVVMTKGRGNNFEGIGKVLAGK
jgi:hypothetical protein